MISANGMCAILLCSHIGIRAGDGLRPYTPTEWRTFLGKVIRCHQEPRMIFEQDGNWVEALSLSSEEEMRIRNLCARGGSAGFEMEALSQKGIEVITMFDAGYPPLMKKRLKRKSPPVLFYAGNLALAANAGIAVAGSRNVDADGMDFTRRLAEKAAMEGLSIFSGGARGVDSVSETVALECGGQVISFIADSLNARIRRSATIRQIMDGNLLLLSDNKPDAGFSVGRAMNRNKYIYSSAQGAFVVASDYNKGGTWAGATEAIRNGWTRVFVWDHAAYAGNGKLKELGAIPYQIQDGSLSAALRQTVPTESDEAPDCAVQLRLPEF